MITLRAAAVSAGFDVNTDLDWAVVLSTISQPGAVNGPYTSRDIIVEPGEYQCRSTMTLGVAAGRPIRLVGDGPVDQNVAPGRGASFVWRKPPDNGGPLGLIRAPSTMVSRIAFRGDGDKMLPASNGIVIEADCELRNSWVTSVKVAPNGAAILITGSLSAGENATGVNMWRLDDVHVRGVWGGGHGFKVLGADGNAGLAVGLDVSDVFGVPVGQPDGGVTGSGIWDASFLGNTYLACHVHQSVGNQAPPIRVNHTWSADTGWQAVSGSNRSRFLGCYVEGLGASRIGLPATWFAGQGVVTGGAMTIGEGRIGSAVLLEPTIRATGTASGNNIARIAKIEVDRDASGSIDQMWTLDYECRPASSHFGWARLMAGANSAQEVLAFNGDNKFEARVARLQPWGQRVKDAEAKMAALEARIAALEAGNG